jgi:hypothetical protein
MDPPKRDQENLELCNKQIRFDWNIEL